MGLINGDGWGTWTEPLVLGAAYEGESPASERPELKPLELDGLFGRPHVSDLHFNQIQFSWATNTSTTAKKHETIPKNLQKGWRGSVLFSFWDFLEILVTFSDSLTCNLSHWLSDQKILRDSLRKIEITITMNFSPTLCRLFSKNWREMEPSEWSHFLFLKEYSNPFLV